MADCNQEFAELWEQLEANNPPLAETNRIGTVEFHPYTENRNTQRTYNPTPHSQSLIVIVLLKHGFISLGYLLSTFDGTDEKRQQALTGIKQKMTASVAEVLKHKDPRGLGILAMVSTDVSTKMINRARDVQAVLEIVPEEISIALGKFADWVAFINRKPGVVTDPGRLVVATLRAREIESEQEPPQHFAVRYDEENQLGLTPHKNHYYAVDIPLEEACRIGSIE
ncbi:hypothetical protein N7492_010257 [Penicillium capsulatum]|uniref:Uncharacterized protein n=1 Tax=Penicillium capsulatum TaxID=69766 RepID=A0A9W9HNY8_9EURO|nr:hypothetical protein N7492_010257 [Penicillium capsulatum]KAJ6112764.1 hypothetical protein N7512_008088 [Penicillium capsulatum]